MKAAVLDQNIQLTIVIVDDNQEDHVLIKTALSAFKNILFNDYYYGKDFLHFLEDKSKKTHSTQTFPNIVILDVKMPGMSGFELFDLVESKGLKGHIKFYILSANFTDDEKRHCLKHGLKFYQKPFDVTHFKKMLEEMISDWAIHNPQ